MMESTGLKSKPREKAKTQVLQIEYEPSGKPILSTATKAEIKSLAQRSIIAVGPNGKWLPGAFRGRRKIGGREKGTPNKPKTVREILAQKKCNPILMMASIAMNVKNDQRLRFDCCKELAGYCHGKVKTVDPVDPLDASEKKELTIFIEGAPIPGVVEDFSDVLPQEEKREVIDVTPEKLDT